MHLFHRQEIRRLVLGRCLYQNQCLDMLQGYTLQPAIPCSRHSQRPRIHGLDVASDRDQMSPLTGDRMAFPLTVNGYDQGPHGHRAAIDLPGFQNHPCP